MKRNKYILGLLSLVTVSVLMGCGNNNEITTGNNNPSENSTAIQSTGNGEQPTSSYPKDYFGTVKFDQLYVHDNDFDGIKIRPILSKPDIAKDEVFTYEVEDESVCEIVDDKVYFVGAGGTKVTAKSEHLKGTFRVYAYDDFVANHSESSWFTNQAKSRCSNVKNKLDEDTTLFVGDSFFQFWAEKTNISESFSDAFKEYNTLNIGINMATSHHWRCIQSKIYSEIKVEPKNIVLNIGINNVDDMSEGGKTCARNVQLLIQDYLECYPNTNIYYFSITRCSNIFASQWENHSESNEIMKKYCENNERLHYLDVMEKYGDDYALYQQDGLHPNQDGYNFFKDLILKNVPMAKIK